MVKIVQYTNVKNYYKYELQGLDEFELWIKNINTGKYCIELPEEEYFALKYITIFLNGRRAVRDQEYEQYGNIIMLKEQPDKHTTVHVYLSDHDIISEPEN